MAHVLATPSTLGFSKKSHWCKKICWRQQKVVKKRHFLLILPPESSSQTNRITTNLVKMMFFYFHESFQRKKTVELKFITSAPPYRLNDLKNRISGFTENSILAVLEHLLERNSVGSLPQFGSYYVKVEMEYKKSHLIYRKFESAYLFSLQI